MTMLRRIEPLAIPDAPSGVDLGARPELRWVAPSSLLVDEAYQRGLGRRSLRLIKELVHSFAWRKMKPPIVVEVEGGLHVVDGQHTAIAAATLQVPEIPVFVVEAATVQERAEAFVGHNRDRIVMAPLDVYRAKVAAGDPDAVDVEAVCRRAGVRLRQINQNAKILAGDTMAVGTVERLVKRRGVIRARMVLEAFVKAERGPISAPEIDAVEAIMVVGRPSLSPELMARAIHALGDHGVIRSKMLAASERCPQKHVLYRMYMELLEKQAPAALQVVHARSA